MVHRLFGLMLGCLIGNAALAQDLIRLPDHPVGQTWPTDVWEEQPLGSDVAEAQLNAAIETLFEAKLENGVPDTRAVLVIRGGKIVFEKYAEGFDQSTRFHSWSVAKSFTNATIGMLVNQGKLNLDQNAPIAAWQSDKRIKITIRQMLNMSSGIDNSDGVANGFLGNAMFGSGALDVNEVVADRPLIFDPGKQWSYSTATSNLLAFVAGNQMGEDRESRQSYVNEHLLTKIGADDIVMSYDKAGYFLGGSHVYATARDYARLGYLYLRDGVWDGERILAEGWVDFSRTPAPAENNGNHGAHFWLNHEGKGWQPDMLPGGPKSAFIMSGNGGQYVYILPTHDMLLVRLGERYVVSWDDLATALASVVGAFPARPATAVEGSAQ